MNPGVKRDFFAIDKQLTFQLLKTGDSMNIAE